MTVRYRANREVLYKGPYKIILCHVFTMPHRGGDSTIKINTLYGYEDVKDIYALDGYDVINTVTGKKKKVSIMSTGYPYVTLEQNGKTSGKKCTMHQLIALAYIRNAPFEVVEHLDDDKKNYRIDNLMFSTQKANANRAFTNGKHKIKSATYRATLFDGRSMTGTIKQISEAYNIPRQTIYAKIYRGTVGKTIKSIVKTGQQTIEKRSDAKGSRFNIT